MYKIEKEKLKDLLAAIAAEKQLYVPASINGQVNLWAYSDDIEVDIETLKTVKSTKDAFFPQSETLYSVSREGKKMHLTQAELADQDFVVFGMRGCDVMGLGVLDQVFLSEPYDSFYAARRRHGVIVSMACHEPEESCFCKVFGNDAADPEGDVATWLIGNEIYWKPISEKGDALTASLSALLESAEEASVEEEQNKIRSIVEKLPYTNLSLEGWGEAALYEKFDSPIWEELYKPCLACGTCTFVCPTCQCYDIRDYDTGHGVKRFRCWDSCMYSDFTMMAHGNNRNSQKERYRQRFMHKLAYHPANNNGTFSCVGCGRCLDKCPASLNIVKVIKAFQKKEENA